MSAPVVEFPSRIAAMRELIRLLDELGPTACPQDLVRIRAVSLVLVGELRQLADEVGDLLNAAGYKTEVRVVPKLEIGRLG